MILPYGVGILRKRTAFHREVEFPGVGEGKGDSSLQVCGIPRVVVLDAADKQFSFLIGVLFDEPAERVIKKRHRFPFLIGKVAGVG